MKRAILALLIIMFAYAAASAQTNGKGLGQKQGLNKNCPSYVDANKDGVCDNLGTINCPYPNAQRQCEQRGGGRGMHNGTGKGCNGQGQGTRNGFGQRNGDGQGRNFTDANNNGICDTFEKQQK